MFLLNVVDFQRTTRRYILVPEDRTLCSHRCENLKSYRVRSNWIRGFIGIRSRSVYALQDAKQEPIILVAVWPHLPVLHGVLPRQDHYLRITAVQPYHSVRRKCHYKNVKYTSAISIQVCLWCVDTFEFISETRNRRLQGLGNIVKPHIAILGHSLTDKNNSYSALFINFSPVALQPNFGPWPPSWNFSFHCGY
jgi:hypothetical protein